MLPFLPLSLFVLIEFEFWSRIRVGVRWPTFNLRCSNYVLPNVASNWIQVRTSHETPSSVRPWSKYAHPFRCDPFPSNFFDFPCLGNNNPYNFFLTLQVSFMTWIRVWWLKVRTFNHNSDLSPPKYPRWFSSNNRLT